MAEVENHFTVFIRLPFKRGDFVDPPPVSWSAARERELWDVISRQTKGNEIDWGSLAEQFQVTQQFLLQQAAWLYERQLSQVRAQMRRMGSRPSATASPVSGSVAASMVGVQTAKRTTSLTSRGPSRLSTQIPTTTTPIETSVPNTPARSRTSLPLKPPASAAPTTTARAYPSSSRPLSRKSSKDNESTSRTHSRRGSIQYHLSKSPGDLQSAETSSSEDETVSKPVHRRPNPASAQRRTSLTKKSQHAKPSSTIVHQLQEEREEDEDEDDPMFLPFASTAVRSESSAAATNDPSATLKSGLPQATPTASTSTQSRPALQRNSTSERIRPATTPATTTVVAGTTSQSNRNPRELQPQVQRQLTSSTSSLSSNNTSNSPSFQPSRASAPPINNPVPHHRRPPASALTGNLPTPLSPRQQAALAAAAGLSPRRRSVNPSNTHGHGHGYTGSESSPSMGSSFSDLDDASVTQSALEEALLSNMNTMGSTTGGIGGLGSRVSGISQALRSRYFDARAPGSGNGNGNGNGNGSGNGNGGGSH